jgi:cysteine synthase A
MWSDGTAVLPTIVRLGDRLWAARFVLMKRVNAFSVVRRARREGVLDDKATVIESSSGSMGIALAEVCREDSYRCIVVTDHLAFDDYARQRYAELGATVHVVESSDPSQTQAARLRRLAELREEEPGAWWTDQYDNPWHRESYHKTATAMLQAVGRLDVVVCPVGTGSSSGGIAEGCRRSGRDVSLVGVDLRGSVLFGLPGGERHVRGMGNGIRPANLVHANYDEVHWLSDAAVVSGLRDLAATHGLQAGPTSGAAWLVARWKHDCEPTQRVCVVLPDTIDRYRHTFARDQWTVAAGLRLRRPPTEPVVLPGVPRKTPTPDWTMFAWGRRTYPDVTGRNWR